MINKPFTAKLLFILFCFYPSISFSAYGTAHHLDESLLKHQANPSIIAVIPAFFPPYYHTDKDGLPYGMAIEVLNEIDHTAGYSTHFIVKNSWVEVFNAIDAGEAQVIPNLGITDARKNFIFLANPTQKRKSLYSQDLTR